MKRSKLVTLFVLACAGCGGSQRGPGYGQPPPSPAAEPAAPQAQPAPVPEVETETETERALDEGPAMEALPGAVQAPTPSSDSLESGGHGVRSAKPSRALTEETRSADFARELNILDVRLRSLAVTETANCEQACDLSLKICALKDNICRLDDQSPSSSVRERCLDAEARCARARRKTEQHCTCGDG